MSKSESKLQQNRIKDLETAFKVFDKNEDGRISKDELKDCLKEANIEYTDDQFEEFMRRVDTDGNGSIDYAEFCVMMNDIIILEKNKFKEIFDAIDVNKDQKIEDTELQSALSQVIGEDVELEEAQMVIRSFDRDGDGHINFDEFVTMLRMLHLDEAV